MLTGTVLFLIFANTVALPAAAAYKFMLDFWEEKRGGGYNSN